MFPFDFGMFPCHAIHSLVTPPVGDRDRTNKFGVTILSVPEV